MNRNRRNKANWIGPAGTMRLLGCSRTTLKSLQANGMPHYRLTPKITRFDPDDVIRWVNSRKQGEDCGVQARETVIGEVRSGR